MNLKETLDWYVKEGYLVAVPNGNLTLYDYTTQCALKGNWNYHTRLARGVVLDEKGNIVSRPFPKFFNLYEREETYLQNLPAEARGRGVEISEKLDGSLVIIFQHPTTKKWTATTRRSWNNVQTQFAYRWLEKNENKLESGWTYNFEAVAPWNKVVVNYPEEKLILTGMIDCYGNDLTYEELTENARNVGLDVVSYKIGRLDTIDPEDIPDNFEGYVARFYNGVRVKIKGQWYLDEHQNLDWNFSGKSGELLQ